MHQPHLTGETPGKTLDGLRRQGDLGHQDDGLATLGQGFLHGAQVDLGLARAGDAVEQDAAAAACPSCAAGPAGSSAPAARRSSGRRSARAQDRAGNPTWASGSRSTSLWPNRIRPRSLRKRRSAALPPLSAYNQARSSGRASRIRKRSMAWRRAKAGEPARPRSGRAASACCGEQASWAVRESLGFTVGAGRMGWVVSKERRIERPGGGTPVHPAQGVVDLLAAQRAALVEQVQQAFLGLAEVVRLATVGGVEQIGLLLQTGRQHQTDTGSQRRQPVLRHLAGQRDLLRASGQWMGQPAPAPGGSRRPSAGRRNPG